MRHNKPGQPRPSHPNRQLRGKSEFSVEPAKHKSPATSAFLNRIKAIQFLRNEKQMRRMEGLRKQVNYKEHNMSLDRDRMLTLSPSKSPEPTNRFSMRLLPDGGQSYGQRDSRHSRLKNVSATLLNKLRRRVRRSPSIEELSHIFPSFKFDSVRKEVMAQNDGNQPTDNLAKSLLTNPNSTSMEEAGYCFYNLTSHQPLKVVEDLQVKGRQTETHKPIIKRGNIGLMAKRVVNINLADEGTPVTDLDGSMCNLCKRESNSAALGIRSVIRQKKKIKNANPVDFVNIFGRADALEGEDFLRFRLLEYKDFLWKVAYSYEFVMAIYERPRYYIGRGNNSKLLRQLMSKRWWWIKEQDQSQATLIWTQLKVQEIYKNQPSFAILQKEQTPRVSTEAIEQTLEDPTRFILNPQLYEKWYRYLLKNFRKEKKSTPELEGRVQLTSSLKPIDNNNRKSMTNHLECSRYIGNKKALFFTMRQYYELSGRHYSQSLPITYHITGGLQDEEYLSFLTSYHDKKKQDQQNIWIVKPGEMSNRGNGITVCGALSEVKKIINNKERHENGKLKTYILQQYICKPFLYNKRKFDIRHYMLICSVNGRLKGYWYEQGYIRTTSYEYNLSRLDSSVHLTNDAVQKYCKDYGRFQKGNKVSYKEFQQYLDSKHGHNKYNFQQLVQTKIKEIATDAIRAAYCSIDPYRRLNNFEIFGLDFMIDSSFKPWLIEINTNPCLELSSPLLGRLIPAMVDNALRICVDPTYPPPSSPLKKVPYEPNRFQLVFDQLVDGRQLDILYRQRQEGVLNELLNGVGEDDQAYQDQSEQQLQQEEE